MLSHFSHVQLLATLWTVTHQVPLSMGFSRQEYWSGLPSNTHRDPPGDLSDQRTETMSLTSPALAPPGKPQMSTYKVPGRHYVPENIIPARQTPYPQEA